MSTGDFMVKPLNMATFGVVEGLDCEYALEIWELFRNGIGAQGLLFPVF